MERFSNIRFNSRRYADHLSVFGRRVLNILVQKWRSDQNRDQHSQHAHQHFNNPIQNRRVLTFRDKETLRPSRIPTTPIIRHEINTGHENHDQSSDYNLEVNSRPQDNIPTTSQLIQTFDTTQEAAARITEDTDISSHDLIYPVIVGSVLNDKRIPNMNDSHTHKPSDKDEIDQANNVDWDNMFDSELFATETAIANAQLVLEQIETPAVNTFNIHLPFEAKKTSQENSKSICDKSMEDDNKNSKPKRKIQSIVDAIPKKLKKVPEEHKSNFRKQKYTTTVNNWLNDLCLDNPIEINEDIHQNKEKKQVEVIIAKATKKSNKKVIQAQLANKDGIMKFKKPKIEIMENIESDNAGNSMSPDVDNINEKLKTLEKRKIVKNTKKENVKTPKENMTEKIMNKVTKSKLKFVAPIKSQIPIKEVEFQITTLEGNNIDNYIEMLMCIENQDLVIVLIYGNGFCQLNYQHTEQTCDPEGFIICIGDDFFHFKGDNERYRQILQSLLEKNKIVCYEGKSLITHLKIKFDLDVYETSIIDAEIGGSILDPDNPPENFSELQKLLSFTPQFTIATECVLQRTAWYLTLLRECASILVKLLVEEELWNVFTNIEMKLLPIIAEMERHGVAVDLEKLKSMENVLLTRMKWTESECHKAAGKSFQINSPAQVRALIYDELKLDAKCNMKIRETLAQGAKSTSESMLRGLVSVHPLPRLILEYRHLHKARATFLTGIAQHVKDGVVKPTWVQTAAATGRIASNNPNLQAIPKVPFCLILFPEANDTGAGRQALNFRSVYTARRGYSLVACDFKHVECRVFAHVAGDEPLRALLRGGGDLFRALAHKWLKKPESEVSAEDRERTKRIVYASLYGAGVRKLMELLAVGYEQALAVHASFNRTFPSLKSFGQSVVSRCEENGGRLATLCGRLRRFRNIASADPALRSQAERQAVNFIIQGSAADLCKLGMVRAHARLGRGRLLLQIHDELVWEVRDEQLPAATAIIKEAMEGVGLQSGMEDTLPVAISIGKNWGEMEEQ